MGVGIGLERVGAKMVIWVFGKGFSWKIFQYRTKQNREDEIEGNESLTYPLAPDLEAGWHS